MSYVLMYLDYFDKATGKTLVVTPGSAYTAVLAGGRNAAMSAYPNDGRWANATTFLGHVIREPAAEIPLTDVSANLGTSTAKDKDKGGA